jgi:alanine-glyoxylate transaminase/serine-glyoxylate transaminase/serine-pyruvate transaminase
MATPVQAHYGPAWVRIYDETLGFLRQVFQTSGDIYPIVGSGSAGLDAAIGSLVGPGQTVLVGVNGYFGRRLADIARACGANVLEIRQTWGEPLQADAFDLALRQNPGIAAVVINQVETSTGVLNPARQIAETANQHAVPILVDAISSLGGMEMAMDEWGIDLCVAASQKCLGAPAGLAPVAVHPRAWAAIEKRGASGHGWYLNLLTWRHFAQAQKDWHPFPVTLPTGAFLAMREGLHELLAEGIPQRAGRFRALATRLRDGLRHLGFSPLVADDCAAPVVTAARSLDGIPSGQVVEFIERVHGLKIAGGGLGPLHDQIFRIGHMAPWISERDIDDVLAALEDFKDQVARPGDQKG